MLNIPCLPVIVSYPKSKITIGAWAITRRDAGLTFSFFVKPRTRTYDWIEPLDWIVVYSEEDFYKGVGRKDKTRIELDNPILKAKVVRILELDDYKLVECRVTQLIEHQFFIFNQGKYSERINTIGWGS